MKKLILIILLAYFTSSLLFSEISGNFQALFYIEDEISYKGEGDVQTKNIYMFKNSIIHNNNDDQILEERVKFRKDTYEIVDFYVKHFSTGKQEIIHKTDNGFFIKYRPAYSRKFQEKTIIADETIYHGSIIALLFAKKLKILVRGEQIDFKLLIPSRFDYYGFKAFYSGNKVLDNKECYEICLQPGSWLVGQFIKPFYFYMDTTSPHKLVAYKGMVSPTDAKGKPQNGHISFSYY